MTTTERELAKAKKRWEQARWNTHLARSILHSAIQDAAEDGMSQAEIGRVLGWPRQRVHSLLEDS